jgi:hypothetical protein
MQIAITGHMAGIGHALAKILESRGHEIVGISRRTGDNIRRTEHVANLIAPCDLFINNVIYSQYYPEFTWFYDGFYWQYASYVLIGLMGLSFKQNLSFFKLFGMSLSGSILFFIISNFGCFIGSEIYSKDLGGLILCYGAGIPFLSATVLGDMFYTLTLSLMIVYAGKKISFLRTVNG